MIGKAAICGAALLLYAVPAAAQILPWRDVVFVNISPGAQTGTRTTTASFSFELYEETADVGVTRDIKGSAFFDVTFGAALIDNIGAAFTFYTRSAASDGAVTGSIPDPIDIDAHRTVTSTVPEMAHRETWFGLQGVYGLGIKENIDVMVMGGPAFVNVEHDLATGATVTETANPAAPAVNVSTTRVSKTFVGFIVGADVRYMFHRNFGVGGFARFTGASGKLPVDDNAENDVELKVGGFQIGAGLRIRY